MTVIVHERMAVVDLATSGTAATAWIEPGRYMLFKRAQLAGASCGQVYTIGETTIGAPVSWWDSLLAESPQFASLA